MLNILASPLDCNNESVLKIVYLVKEALRFIQIFIPIILIILCMIDGIRNVASSEVLNPKILKKMINRAVAAACVFLVPVALNMTLNLLNEKKITIGKCWKEATEKGIKKAKEEDIDLAKKIKIGGKASKDYRNKLAKDKVKWSNKK